VVQGHLDALDLPAPALALGTISFSLVKAVDDYTSGLLAIAADFAEPDPR
jgi:hypothetical protein